MNQSEPLLKHLTNRHRGALYMLLAFFMIAVFSTCSKAALLKTSHINVSFFSFGTSFLIQVFLVAREPLVFFHTKKLNLHIGRALFGLSASMLFFLAVRYISLIDAILLFNTTPLFIPLLSILFLKVYPSLRSWLAIGLGFIGILILIRPDATIVEDPGALIGLLSGLSLAFAFLFIKLLTQTEPLKRINFYFFTICILLLTPFYLIYGTLPPKEAILFCILGGCFGSTGQYFLVKAYQCAEPADIGVFQYSVVIFGGLFDWMFWNQVPVAYDILGVVIVVIAAAVILKRR